MTEELRKAVTDKEYGAKIFGGNINYSELVASA